jgi:hypothetical protein
LQPLYPSPLSSERSELKVSESKPAKSNPAIAGGALKPASSVCSETKVEVLPTVSTVNLIG